MGGLPLSRTRRDGGDTLVMPNIYDVAKRARVSVATVSAV
jgi:hypothetical protein